MSVNNFAQTQKYFWNMDLTSTKFDLLSPFKQRIRKSLIFSFASLFYFLRIIFLQTEFRDVLKLSGCLVPADSWWYWRSQFRCIARWGTTRRMDAEVCFAVLWLQRARPRTARPGQKLHRARAVAISVPGHCILDSGSGLLFTLGTHSWHVSRARAVSKKNL